MESLVLLNLSSSILVMVSPRDPVRIREQYHKFIPRRTACGKAPAGDSVPYETLARDARVRLSPGRPDTNPAITEYERDFPGQTVKDTRADQVRSGEWPKDYGPEVTGSGLDVCRRWRRMELFAGISATASA
jgi:hypothetical protein